MKQPATKKEFDEILAGAAAAGKAVVVDFTASCAKPHEVAFTHLSLTLA